MPEKSSANQIVQIGVESTAGTAVAATKQLTSFSFIPALQVETTQFTPAGSKYTTLSMPVKEWSDHKISGVPTYTELPYILSSLVNAATPAQQGGTTAYKWTYTSAQGSADAVKTYTVEQGDSSSAWRFAGVVMNSLSFEFSRDGVKAEGAAFGKAIETGVSLSGSASAISLVPILPTQVDVYLSDTQAGLDGASALSRSFVATWGLSNRQAPIWPLGTTGSSGYAATIEDTPEIAVSLKMAADSTGMGLLTNMRAGSTKWIRIKAVGETIASTYKYTLQIDTPIKVRNVSKFGDDNKLYMVQWDCVGVYDATWAKPFQIELTTTTSAL